MGDDPEARYAEQQRAKELAPVVDRFGEWYRIGWDGVWFAEGGGDKITAETAVELAIAVGDHMAANKPPRRSALAADERPEPRH